MKLKFRKDPYIPKHMNLDLDAKPINDTLVMRLVTLALYRLCKQRWYWRWRKSNWGVFFVSSKLCLRCAERTLLNEARAMQLVREHTSIPVPKVYCSFRHRGQAFILMERLSGKSLSDDWYARDDASKAKIFDQLRRMIAELRAVPRPQQPGGDSSNSEGVVSGVDGGQFFDGNLPDKRFWGPFATVGDFHRELRCGVTSVPDEWPEEQFANMRRLLVLHAEYDAKAGPTVLTHGDLSANNILAQGDTVTGIVDWETAAWMPAYWEYTQAWHVPPNNPYWQEEVHRFLGSWPEELEMEKLRRIYFDVF